MHVSTSSSLSVKLIKMTITKLTDTQRRIGFKNGDFLTIIGTAHISKQSQEEVRTEIENINPDSIIIELDQNRWDKIHKTEKEDFSSLDVGKVIKSGRAFLLIANLILSSFQKKLNLNEGNIVGAEIVTAGDIAKEKGIALTLGDRDITTTLTRVWRLSGFMTKCKMIATLLSAAFDKSTISEAELESLKNSSNIEVMLDEIAKDLPEAKAALIDERDAYLASKIYNAEGHNKIAVVGAGHVGGLLKKLEELDEGKSIDTDALDVIPPKGKASKVLNWLVPITLVAVALGIGIVEGWKQGLTMFIIWAISNASSTLVFSILSLAHPLTCLVAAVSAPVAALSPILGVGIISSVFELGIKKPLVRDIENLSDDVILFKKWFKNRVLHAFTILILTSVGSMIGTFVVFPALYNWWI